MHTQAELTQAYCHALGLNNQTWPWPPEQQIAGGDKKAGPRCHIWAGRRRRRRWGGWGEGRALEASSSPLQMLPIGIRCFTHTVLVHVFAPRCRAQPTAVVCLLCHRVGVVAFFFFPDRLLCRQFWAPVETNAGRVSHGRRAYCTLARAHSPL